jgi:uncharacterized protein YjbI with pentapeptide repeats
MTLLMTVSVMSSLPGSLNGRGVAFADTAQPRVRLGPFAGNLTVGPGMVASGHRLWGSAIVGQNLRQARFDDCDLSDVLFEQCDLTGATFRRCVLTGTIFDDCILSDNDYSQAVINGINDADVNGDSMRLSLSQLRSTWSFQNKNLSDCEISCSATGRQPPAFNFDGFSLVRAEFHGVDLTTSDFTGASFYEITFVGCRVNLGRLAQSKGRVGDCNFKNCEFVGQLDVSGKHFHGEMTSRESIPDVDLLNAHVAGITSSGWLTPEKLTWTASYKMGYLANCSFVNCDFSGLDLSRQVLTSTRFSACDLRDVDFTDSVISGTEFNRCNGLTTGQVMSTWNYKTRRMHLVQLPPALQAQLDRNAKSGE